MTLLDKYLDLDHLDYESSVDAWHVCILEKLLQIFWKYAVENRHIFQSKCIRNKQTSDMSKVKMAQILGL